MYFESLEREYEAIVDSLYIIFKFKIYNSCPDWYGSVGWTLSCKPKGHWFSSWSVRMPGLWGWVEGQVPGWGHARDNQWLFLSHVDGSLPYPSLKINK